MALLRAQYQRVVKGSTRAAAHVVASESKGEERWIDELRRVETVECAEAERYLCGGRPREAGNGAAR